MQKVILLSRVSTGLQDLEQQTESLIKYAKAIGYTEQDFIIIEDKESAVKLAEEERNGLNKLKESIEHNPVRDVIVYELSRIARVPKILYSIRDYLIERNIQLHVLNPQFKLLKQDGTIDESANVIFSLFCSMAENEGYLRKQRFARRRTKLANENRYFGGKLPFGYGFNKDKEFIIIEEERDIVVRIFQEYKTRVITDIARDLLLEGKIPASTLNAATCFVRNILHREAYTGIKTNYNGQREKRFAVSYPRIISVEDYKEAQVKLKERKKYIKTKSKHVYLCRNIVTNINGDILRPIISHGAYTYIKLNKYTWETLSIKIELLDKIAFHFAIENKKRKPGKDLTRYKVDLQQELKVLSKKASTIAKKIEEYNEQLIRIETRYISGKISEKVADLLSEKVQKEINLLNKENQSLEDDREDLTKRLNNLLKSPKESFLGNLRDLTEEDKEKIVKEEIERITVIKGKRKNDYTLGIQYFSGDYVLADLNSLTKKLHGENGELVEYEKTSINCLS